MTLKGLLHGVGAGVWGHDLADLIARAGKALTEEVPERVRTADLRLSRHNIANRYPDAHPSGTPGGRPPAIMSRSRSASPPRSPGSRTVVTPLSSSWRARVAMPAARST